MLSTMPSGSWAEKRWMIKFQTPTFLLSYLSMLHKCARSGANSFRDTPSPSGASLYVNIYIYIYIYIYYVLYITYTIPWNKCRPFKFPLIYIFFDFFFEFWRHGTLKFKIYRRRSSLLQNSVEIRWNFDGFVNIFRFFKNAAYALLLFRGLV